MLRSRLRLSRTERTAGAVALALGLLHLLLANSSGTDLAAQLARASFARAAPLTPVDLSWYSGIHPFGYSLLAPWVMALLGVTLSGLLAAVAASVLFARLLRDTERPLLGAVLGAVFAVADVASGRTTFALGAVTALAALAVLPRLRLAAALAVVTALLSPVAAAFLGFAAGLLVLHRRSGGWTLGVSCALPVLAVIALFPGRGVQPFSTTSGIDALVAAGLLALVTSLPTVRTGALLYAAAVVVLLNHADPFGSNVLRLGLLVAAPLVLATSRRHLLLVLAGAAYCLWWQAGPIVGDLRDLRDHPQVNYTALTQQLEKLHSRRAEVLATRDHRESWLVAEHIPLARGWARQIDEDRNRIFYDHTLTSATYRTWLLDNAVDAVAVPRSATLDFASSAESALVVSGTVPELEQVWSDDQWVLYRVADPRPIAAAPAVVVESSRTVLLLASTTAVDVKVQLHWSRWLSVAGAGCVRRDGDEVLVRFTRPGQLTLSSSLLPKQHC